jgi:NADPH2:quinone reductase
MRAMQALEYGGSDMIRERALELPAPAPGEARVRVEAAGVNFIDIYQRTGLYPTEQPVRLGLEGAGVVEAVGSAVSDLSPGTRVAWVDVRGSYATHVNAPADRLVQVPADVSSEQAAAAMLQGMTAHYLTHDTFPLAAGHTCLVHAAAGGVGLLLCQLAKRRGARVIGTVSTPEKAELAQAAGADDIIFYTREELRPRVRELTGGAGVHVAYDSVGKDTWEASLDSLAPRGTLVMFGQSSGVVPPIELGRLARGSLFLTRTGLVHHVSTRAELLARAGAVLDLVRSGELRLRIDQLLPLAEAARAHDLLASRATKGKLLLNCR